MRAESAQQLPLQLHGRRRHPLHVFLRTEHGERRTRRPRLNDVSREGWIQLGQDVGITLDALPGQELSGTVVSISPVADSASGIVSYRVVVETEASDLPLRSGMTANAEIVREEREDALLVPNLAISFDPETGSKYVTRQRADGLELVQITTGLVTDQFSEVLSGLESGDEVVVSSTSARDQFRDMMGSTFTGGGQ